MDCVRCTTYKKAGITYLKIVGRGNYTEFMQQDIIRLKKSAYDFGNSGNEKRIPDRMKQELFPRR